MGLMPWCLLNGNSLLPLVQVGAQLAAEPSKVEPAVRAALLANLSQHYQKVVLSPQSGFKEVAVAVRAIGALARPTARLQGPQVRPKSAQSYF